MTTADAIITLRGDAVRDLLQRDAVTVTALAERMHVDRSHLHKMLSGDRPTPWRQLAAMAVALNVNPSTIADFAVRARTTSCCGNVRRDTASYDTVDARAASPTN